MKRIIRGNQYPGVRGKVVDWVEHEFTEGSLYIHVRFQDKTELTYTLGCRLVIEEAVLGDISTGNYEVSPGVLLGQVVVTEEDHVQKTRRRSLSVDALVQPTDEPVGTDFEHAADSKQRHHRNGAASLDLLPVTCREPERNHVLLRVTGSLSELLRPLSKAAKEPGVVDHATLCNATRAEIPRAD